MESKQLTRGPWLSVFQVEGAHKGHWFSRGALRFFKSRIHYSDIYGGRFFVTSEKPPHAARCFSVRIANDDATIDTLGDFCGYATRAQAHSAAKHAASLLAEPVTA